MIFTGKLDKAALKALIEATPLEADELELSITTDRTGAAASVSHEAVGENVAARLTKPKH